jgi:hypothetical protein
MSGRGGGGKRLLERKVEKGRGRELEKHAKEKITI